jgi:hypothetical protein
MLPKAYIIHHTPDRLRIKIPSQKGNKGYFSFLEEKLSNYSGIKKIKTNTLTGSVLFIEAIGLKEALSLKDIGQYGEANNLFSLQRLMPYPTPLSQGLSQKIITSFNNFNKKLVNFTSGELDIASVSFLFLLGLGLYQISRGNLIAPAWYTAFWYAANIILKTHTKAMEL